MKLGPKQKKFIKLLKTQGHLQGRAYLGRNFNNSTIKMCCLGLAGFKVLNSCEFKKDMYENHYNLVEKGSRDDLGLKESFKELGLYSDIGGLKPYNPSEPASLVEFNDSPNHEWGYWVDLAYMMEAYPELFFAKSR